MPKFEIVTAPSGEQEKPIRIKFECDADGESITATAVDERGVRASLGFLFKISERGLVLYGGIDRSIGLRLDEEGHLYVIPE